MKRPDSWLGRTKPKALKWIFVKKTDLPRDVVAGHGEADCDSCLLGLLPDGASLVCGVAYERYEQEHQAGGLSADTNFWVTHYDYYRVDAREVSPDALKRLLKQS